MPGIFRLFLVWLIAFSFGATESASFVSSFLLATAVAMIGGGGFGIVHIRKIVGTARHVRASIGGWLLCCGSIVSVIAALIVLQFSASEMLTLVILSIVLTLWQVERHGWLADRKFLQLCIFDSLLLFLCCSILFINFDWVLPAIAASHIFIVLTSYTVRIVGSHHRGDISTVFDVSDVFSGMKIGLTTFVSGGILFMLPSIVERSVSSDSLALLSLIVAATGALFILPRSYLNQFIGTLAKLVKHRKVGHPLVQSCISRVRILGLSMLIPAIVFSVIYVLSTGANFTSEIIVLSVMICSAMLVGQMYIVESNLLLFLRLENISLTASVVVFAVMIIGTNLLTFFIGNDILLFCSVFVLLGGLYVLRWFYFMRVLKPYMDSNKGLL